MRRAGRVARCLWCLGTTAQPAPSQRTSYRGEMSLQYQDLVSINKGKSK